MLMRTLGNKQANKRTNSHEDIAYLVMRTVRKQTNSHEDAQVLWKKNAL